MLPPRNSLSVLWQERDRLENNIRKRWYFRHHEDGKPMPFYLSAFHPRPENEKIEEYFFESRAHLRTLFEEAHTQSYRALSRSEMDALLSLQRDSIIIRPADKNLGATVMDPVWYRTQILNHLLDYSTYTEVNPSEVPWRAMKAQLKRITESIFGNDIKSGHYNYFLEFAKNDKLKPVPFYIIPKLHKNPISSRPISACHSYITTPVAKWLADLLKPVVSRIGWVCESSTEVINALQDLDLRRNDVLLTIDVEKLYPSIPTVAAIAAVSGATQRELQLDNHHANIVRDALDFVLNNHYVSYEGDVHRQISGTAMGVAMAPQYANIFLATLEQPLLQYYQPQLVFYKRYIDDICLIWRGPKEQLAQFKTDLNSLHPNLHFTFEQEGRAVDFLDLKLSIADVARPRVSVDLHAKVLNKYLYVPWSSYHTRDMKAAFIKAELLRHLRNNSTRLGFLKTTNKFWSLLRERGYPITFLKPLFDAVLFLNRQTALEKKRKTDNTNNSHPLWFVTEHPPWMLKVPHRELANPNPFHSSGITTCLTEADQFLSDLNIKLSIKSGQKIGSLLT